MKTWFVWCLRGHFEVWEGVEYYIIHSGGMQWIAYHLYEEYIEYEIFIGHQ